MRLPNFGLNDYLLLIDNLRDAGYSFRKIDQMPSSALERTAYLRHDIDLHILQIDKMAKAEAARGVTATYYVLLTQPYNLLHPENRRILETITRLGHDVGLHYDLTTYPVDPGYAREHLEWEVNLLSEIVGQSIRTIVMHNPSLGQLDPFRQIDDYVNPHDPRYQEDLLYVSDSCRAWRDEKLLTCFGPDSPRRLLLNTHPELWLDGTIDDRMSYLDQVVAENVVHQHREYLEHSVRQLWLSHPGPKLHDERPRHPSIPIADRARES